MTITSQKEADQMQVAIEAKQALLDEWNNRPRDKYYYNHRVGMAYRVDVPETSAGYINLAVAGKLFDSPGEARLDHRKDMARTAIFNKLRELEGDWVVDWKNHEQKKYRCMYNHSNKKWEVSFACYAQQCEPGWCSTKEVWQWVIEHMEDELNLLWGVEK